MRRTAAEPGHTGRSTACPVDDALDLVGVAVHGPANAVDKSLKDARLHA